MFDAHDGFNLGQVAFVLNDSYDNVLADVDQGLIMVNANGQNFYLIYANSEQVGPQDDEQSQPEFTDDEILTIRRLLAVVAKSPEAYALSGRLEDIYGELSYDDVTHYTVGNDNSDTLAVIPSSLDNG